MRPGTAMRCRIVAGGVALIIAIAASAAYDGWRLHEQIMASTERELGNLANALSEQAARSLQAIDMLLRDTAAWYEFGGRGMDSAALQDGLAARVAGVSQVSVLTIVDAQGMQRYRSRQTGEPMADVSDRSYFISQRDAVDRGMYIHEPIVTRTERLPALVVSRRLQGPRGEFDGVVTAAVTLLQIQQMYSAIDLGSGSTLLMTTSNGSPVVRQPPVEGLARIEFPKLVALRGGTLVDHSIGPVDGRRKLISVVGVGSWPLLLGITLDEEQALMPWHDAMRSALVRTAVLSVLAVVTILGLLQQLRRLEMGELALRKSEQRYAMVLDAANEGHAEWNIETGETFASERWRALHKIDDPMIDSAAAIAHTVQLHPDDRELVKEAMEEHLGGKTPAIEIEYRVRMAPGDDEAAWHWIHARARCVFSEDGVPQRLFCAASDVSARKAAEAERARLQARLLQTQRLEALGTLAGGIAHDFNNVLGVILGFSEMAERQVEPGGAAQASVQRVLQAAARARLLVRRILDFSRRGVSERVPVNVQAVVEEVIAMLAPTLPSGLTLGQRMESGNAATRCDATQLHQVVMNLCTNAVYAMNDCGALEISSRCVDVAEGRCVFQGELHAGRYVCVEVADTGHGIPDHLKARIFDPFYTTRRAGQGTGLGLSVVHGIVSDIGGAIDVADRVEGGTLITVWLPQAGEALRPPPAIEADWPQGDGQTVMVVDDEDALVALAEEGLAGLGYEPVGYRSCEAALRAFAADPDRFDAVVCDVMLPGMSGTELARRLRAMRSHIPIILVSGNVSEAIENLAREGTATAVLHKPISLRDLAQCLAGKCGLHFI
jgi:signal transduction histidine kinase